MESPTVLSGTIPSSMRERDRNPADNAPTAMPMAVMPMMMVVGASLRPNVLVQNANSALRISVPANQKYM